MTEKTIDETLVEAEINIRKELLQSLPLLILIILIPLLAANSCMKPVNEDASTWFQRSGSLMIVFAIWIEFKLFKVADDIFLNGIVTDQQSELAEKYRCKFEIMKYLAVIGALFGSVIWGYGDIIYKIFI